MQAKWRFGVSAAGLVLAGFILSSLTAQVPNPGGQSDESRIQTGLAIAPVPLNLHGLNHALVGLGSYFVNVNCVDCHTCPTFTPGHNPFLGQSEQINTTNYLAGGRKFGPIVVSRNLTPEDGLPAGRTFSEFELIMRTGFDFDHAHPALPLLQTMPWPGYKFLTDRDLRAIYEYLRAIPPAEPGPVTAGCGIPP
jgi:hypothetical protein